MVSELLNPMISCQWEKTDLSEIPPDYQTWLAIAGNLTLHLKNHFSKHRFACLSQALDKLPTTENAILKQNTKYGLVRTIMHYNDHTPLVFARTVISQKLYHKHQTLFDNLGEKPIGSTLLYGNASVKRSAFEFGTITQNDDYPTLYARRSIFSFPGQEENILISEFFLPGILVHA